MYTDKATECPNCGNGAEWNSDSNIDCGDCGTIITELVDSDPYVVEHRLEGETVALVELEAR